LSTFASRPSPVRTVGLINLLKGGDGRPLHLVIYHRIRHLIATGALPAGTRLPSSRALAGDLGVARNTVVEAIELLVADGWIETRRGSGAYVAEEPPRVATKPPPPAPEGAAERLTDDLPFSVGIPGLGLFRADAWNRVQARCWRSMPREALLEGHPLGWPALREVVASQVQITRGVVCSPEQVIITSGARNALDLTVRALLGPGSRAVVEDPGYFAVSETLRWNGVTPAPSPVDAQGLRLPDPSEAARMAVMTPACEFPLCVVMSPDRREAWTAWAAERGGWIFEDDYDSEFHFEGQSLPPLAAQPGASRVIYANSFNKLLFPSLRLGYLIVPTSLVELFAKAALELQVNAGIPNQVVLAEFIRDGHLDRHLRTARTAYGARRRRLVAALEQELAGFLEIRRQPVGLHLVARILRGSEAEWIALAAERGVHLVGMSRFATAPAEPGVLLGFAGFDVSDLQAAAAELGRAARAHFGSA